MRQIFLLIGLFSICNFSPGQDSKRPFISEAYFSVNRTYSGATNYEDRYGFGIGADHSFSIGGKFEFLVGAEYNRTNQFAKSFDHSHFSDTYNVAFSMDCFSLPQGIRFNMGKKVKVFLEAGQFFDFVVRSWEKGTVTYAAFQSPTVFHYTTNKFKERAHLPGTPGFYAGLGLRIPMSHCELMIKPEFRNRLITNELLFKNYFRLNIGIKFK